MKKPLAQVTEFCEQSSIPGFSRLGTFNSRIARLMWLCVLLISFIGVIVHLGVNTARYARRGIVTQTMLNEAAFVFPDVTICNNFPLNFHRSVGNFTVDGNIMNGRTFLYKIKDFWRASLNISIDKLNGYSRPDNPISRLSLDRYAMHNDLAHHLDELLLRCKYKGQECHLTDFHEYRYPFYQNCFTFRPHNRETEEAGRDQGLSMVLSVGDRRALLNDNEILSWLRGAVIVVHPADTLPVIKDATTIATSGEFTLVELEMIKSIRADRKDHHCVVPNEGNKILTTWIDWKGRPLHSRMSKYSAKVCMELQRQERVVEECGCYSEDYFVKADGNKSSGYKKYCHELGPEFIFGVNYHLINGTVYVEDNDTGLIQFSEWRVSDVQKKMELHQCHDRIRKEIAERHRSGPHSRCSPACETLSYTASVTAFSWPESVRNSKPALTELINIRLKNASDPATLGGIRDKYLSKLEQIRTRFLQVEIYPKYAEGILMEETMAYPFSGYFSDIGGVLGLWAGMSIITFIEIFSGCLSVFESKQKRKQQQGRRNAVAAVENGNKPHSADLS